MQVLKIINWKKNLKNIASQDKNVIIKKPILEKKVLAALCKISKEIFNSIKKKGVDKNKRKENHLSRTCVCSGNRKLYGMREEKRKGCF